MKRLIVVSLSIVVGMLTLVACKLTEGQPEDTVPQVEASEYPIIDMHLHALPLEFFPPDPMIPFERPDNNEQLVARTIEEMERHNVVKALVSGIPDLLEQYRQNAPERTIPSLMISPLEHEQPREALVEQFPQVRSWVEQGHFEAIGEVATQYAGVSPSDDALEGYFDVAEEHGIPVGIHVGLSFPGVTFEFAPSYRIRHGSPLDLEDMLADRPELKVYMMHAGYPLLDETIALMSIYPQAHADLSAINWILPREEFHRYLKALVDAGHADRLMFGSDQMAWPGAIAAGIEGIESADFLTEEQKRGIFFDNAARFLGLSEEEIAQHHQ